MTRLRSKGESPTFDCYLYPGETSRLHGPSEEMLIGTISMDDKGEVTFCDVAGVDCRFQVRVGLASVFADIARRRDAQDVEYGGPDHDDRHLAAEWLRFIDKFRDRAGIAINSGADYEDHLLNIAALACAAIESSRRKRHGASIISARV